MILKFLLSVLSCFLMLFLFTVLRKPYAQSSVNIYFGLPGAGKTTFCAYLSKKYLNHGVPVWSNVPILGTYVFDVREDLARYEIENGILIVDEAGIDYNNRQYSQKNGMTAAQIKWWKKIRHKHMKAYIFSQSYNDMDVTLRRLCGELFIIKKSKIKYFVTVRRIRRKVDIDDIQHIPVDMYYKGLPVIDTYRCFMPTVWKMFDSYESEPLPPKNWVLYDNVSRFSEPVSFS